MHTRLEELKALCEQYHLNHPEVWELFVKFTNEIILKGYKNYSVSAVFERIRWEIDTGGDGVSEFKINNNFKPLYARKFMSIYPEYAGFFRTRQQTTASAPATGKPELTPKDLVEAAQF